MEVGIGLMLEQLPSQLFACPLTTIRNEKTFYQDILEVLKHSLQNFWKILYHLITCKHNDLYSALEYLKEMSDVLHIHMKLNIQR